MLAHGVNLGHDATPANDSPVRNDTRAGFGVTGFGVRAHLVISEAVFQVVYPATEGTPGARAALAPARRDPPV